MRPAALFPLLLVAARAPASGQCELGELRGLPSVHIGWSVALDGERAILANGGGVGKPAAFVVQLQGGEILQRLALPEGYATSVDLEGDRAVVGYDSTPGEGSNWVYVFQVSSGELLYSLTTDDDIGWDGFGDSVAIEGDRLLVGDSGSFKGIVYVYDLWTGTERMQIHAPFEGGFGSSLDVSGDVAITGRWIGPYAFLLDLEAGRVVHRLKFPDDVVVPTVAIDGERAVVGNPYAADDTGEAFVYDVASGTRLLRLSAPGGVPGDGFGRNVAVDGDLVAVSSGYPNTQGVVYFFDVNTGKQLFEFTLETYAGIGWSGLALDERHVLVGVPSELEGQGRIHVFRRPHPVGTRYCPGVPNSTGGPGLLLAGGSESADCNCLHLRAEDLPVQQATMMLVGSDTDHVPFAGGGQGTLCLGGSVARLRQLAGSSDEGGSFGLWIDLGEAWPLGGPVLPGETWRFQAWYRDMNPGPTSNFTNAMSVTFD